MKEIWLGVFRTDSGEPALWRKLEPGQGLVIGRAVEAFPGSTWQEPYLSRRHLELAWVGQRPMLKLVVVDGARVARNEWYLDAGRTLPLPEPWLVECGRPLFLGHCGTTILLLTDAPQDVAGLMQPVPANTVIGLEPAYQKVEGVSDDYAEWLELPRTVRYQLRLFQTELPGAVQALMAQAEGGEADLFDRLADALCAATAGGGRRSVAFVTLDRTSGAIHVLNAGASKTGEFTPSRTLLHQALQGRAGHPTVWTRAEAVTTRTQPINSLVGRPVDWALTVVLPSFSSGSDGEPAPLLFRGQPLFLYMEERNASALNAKALLPFARTVGLLVASLIEVREHQRMQTQLAQSFSPRLRQVLRERPEALEAAVLPCTVLCCDRRGSSRAAEGAEDDAQILAQLRDNQAVLGEVTRMVFEHNGAVADFAGDAVLGFWGWPPDPVPVNHASAALVTAQAIAQALAPRLHRDARQRVTELACRIGISTGPMAVGNVGPAEQMKIGVFGSPVNFGSRLEGLGKQFRLPVIVSDHTVREVRGGPFVFRRLAYLRPAGFDQVYPIYELVLPREWGGSGLDAAHIKQYEEALTCFTCREWDACVGRLGDLVALADGPAVWLQEQAERLRREPPPADWMGGIEVDSK